MMTLGGLTYLDLSDMERVGIKRNTLLVAKSRGATGWSFASDPKDKRRVLVLYNTLREDVKALVDAVFGAAVADHRLNAIKEVVAADPADIATLRGYVLHDGQRLPLGAVERYARACAYLRHLSTTPRDEAKRMGFAGSSDWHVAVIALVKAEGLELPTSYTKLREKVRDYEQRGALAVISGKWGNQNRRKIEGPIEDWLIAQYAQPTKPDAERVATLYNKEAVTMGWPSLTSAAVYHHLMLPAVMPEWYLGRHGAAAFKAKFSHTLKTRAAGFRDALWVGDGTKCNLFYRDGSGMAASMQMYIVMDAHSEVILGWSLSQIQPDGRLESENFQMQYRAAKMALQRSQARPMQWLYDNQGGHKKGETQDFYTRASKLHFPAQPYNAQAKPVESLIGRFQQHVMRSAWFFTGQNITAKRLDSRPNMEFINAHKDSLPELRDLPRIIDAQVNEWNEMRNPRVEMSRNATYATSVNPHHAPLDIMDMVELFWMMTPREVQYRKEGITIEVRDVRHVFEVYDANGNPDEAFRRQYLNAHFVVKYDLDNLDFVFLYRKEANGDLRQVAAAQTKQTVARTVIEMLPGERAIINHSLELRKRAVEEMAAELAARRERSGIDPETLVELAPYGGVPKEDITRAETALALPTAPAHYEDDIVEGEDEDQPRNPYDAL